mmetsp:Transcript_10830/g.29969  ORF Transcript_10830/g.29969 Transcript_10830/m.29969 type:complete len:426 (-) Transcript_10830:51-1328(-)
MPKPPAPLRCLKNHVEGKWEKQVYDPNEEVWLTLEEWKEHLEPDKKKSHKDNDGSNKSSSSKPDSKLKKNIKKKTKQAFLGRLETNLTANLSLLRAEIVAKVLNETEQHLRHKLQEKKDDMPPEQVQVLQTAATLINHISGVVLSYRFTAPHSKAFMPPPKAKFLKTTTIQRLSAGLYPLVVETTDKVSSKVQQKLPALQRELHLHLKLLAQGEIHTLAEQVLDQVFDTARNKSDALLDEAHQRVVDKIQQAQNHPVWQITGLQPPQPPGGMVEAAPSKQDVQAKKDEIGLLISSAVKEAVLSKVSTLQDYIIFYLDQLLMMAAMVAHQVQHKLPKKPAKTGGKMKKGSNNAGSKSNNAGSNNLVPLDETEFTEALGAQVDELYQQFEDGIADEVHKAVQGVSGLLEAHENDNSEDGKSDGGEDV